MLVRFSKYLGVVTLSAVLSTTLLSTAAAQQPAGQAGPTQQPAGQAGQAAPAPGGKQVKDKGEYDLFQAVTTEQNPQKRLDLLNQWTQKYADTDFKKERLLFYLTTYQQLNKPAEMIDSANKILAMDPKDMTALYWLTTLSLAAGSSGDNSPANLDRGEKAAQGMLANMDETFSDAKKPANTDAAAWAKAKTGMAAVAHKGLGWVSMVRKNADPAVSEFKQSLAADPNQGEVLYWLGQTLYGTKDEAKIPEGLFYYARAVQYDGPGALAPAGRKQIDDFLTRAYKGYHGSTEGLDQLKAMAKANPTPPPDFKLRSVKDVAKEQADKENAEAAADPAGVLWKRIKAELAGPNADQYFNGTLKDAALPELKGKVVSASPAARPNTIVLAMSDDTTGEVTLKLVEGTMAGKAEPGTLIHFTGAVPKSFTASPLMLTMEVEKANIKGWPAAAPAARPRPAGGARKKK